MSVRHDIGAIAQNFQIRGQFLEAAPYGSGHINDTYRAVFNQEGRRVRYIIQRINHGIFKQPATLMENIQRVTAHLREKVSSELDAGRRVLTLVPALSGQTFFRDDIGNYWRAYNFIEAARSYDAVETPSQALAAATAFGRFQKLLSDLPAPRLHDTIPDFHDTPKRFAKLEKAIEADAVNRAALAKPEIEFALNHKAI
jgi:hypothetical protein